MGDKKTKNGRVGIGEINTIRDILMGEQFHNFEMQIAELREELELMRQNVKSSVSDLKSLAKQESRVVRVEMLKKIVDLENRMVKSNDKLNNKIKKDKFDQNNKLSKLFIEMGKALEPKGK